MNRTLHRKSADGRTAVQIKITTKEGYLSVMGTVCERSHAVPGAWIGVARGCNHATIAALAPEVAPFLAWHLADASTGEPMRYEANTLYYLGLSGSRGAFDLAAASRSCAYGAIPEVRPNPIDNWGGLTLDAPELRSAHGCDRTAGPVAIGARSALGPVLPPEWYEKPGFLDAPLTPEGRAARAAVAAWLESRRPALAAGMRAVLAALATIPEGEPFEAFEDDAAALADALPVTMETRYGAPANPGLEGADGWTCALAYEGRTLEVPFYLGSAHGGREPEVREVLSCLASDAQGADGRTFEEWASEYGYDADSREAEKTFKACQSIARKLKRFLGAKVYARIVGEF